MSEKAGAIQCKKCYRWFKNRGGFTVHRCRREEEEVKPRMTGNRGGTTVASQGKQVECGGGRRIFRRPGDLKTHKCLDERSKPVEEQHGSL